MNVTFLGTGGFATALAIHLGRWNQAVVTLWGRDPQFTSNLSATRVNDRHLPGIPIPPEVIITNQLAEVSENTEVFIASIPTAFLRTTLQSIKREIPPEKPVISLVKGIEMETLARPSQIILEILGPRPVIVLSGPSHAEEVAVGRPTSVVVAGTDNENTAMACNLFNAGSLRVYSNHDPLGVELAGALKNIFGIAAGICDGLGFGDNAKAALLTRGLVEMTRFAVRLGAQPATFFGLAGVGDLMTTCFSPHGRNRALGERLAQGLSLADAQNATSNVVEGVFTTFSVSQAARQLQIDMPITLAVEKVLQGVVTPRAAVAELMSRPARAESFEFNQHDS